MFTLMSTLISWMTWWHNCRIFLYMPLQHSEALEDVSLAVKLFSDLNQTAPQPQKERFTSLSQWGIALLTSMEHLRNSWKDRTSCGRCFLMTTTTTRRSKYRVSSFSFSSFFVLISTIQRMTLVVTMQKKKSWRLETSSRFWYSTASVKMHK